MRVLHLIKTADGAAWAYRQIKVLREKGAEVAVCLPEGKMSELYRKEGFKVYPFTFSLHPLKVFGLFSAFRKILKDFAPDLVHSHFVITTIFARLYRLFYSLKLPLIFQVPGPLHLEHTITRNAELAARNKYDYWIASCQWTKDKYLQLGMAPSKVFLSFYGTDLSYIKKHEKGKLRTEFHIPDDAFVVGIVAYMYAPKKYLGQKKGLKGHEDFIEGVSLAMKDDNTIYAAVIGGAWNNAHEYERSLVEMGAKYGGDKIIFTGTRSDVPELYPDIDLVIHPSYSENLGGAAESLLLGVPTVATNVGGFPDIVIHGKTGCLINPGKPAEIAAAIKNARSNYEKAKEMAANGNEYVKHVLDVRNTAAQVYEIYNQILKK